MDSLLDQAPCGFLSFTDDGRITLANSMLGEMLGRSLDDLLGQHVDSILTTAGRILYQAHFFPMLKLQGKVEEFFFSVRTQADEDLPVLVNAARRREGEAFHNDCILMSMQRRSRYEDEILRARRLAEKAIRDRNRTNAELTVALARERRIALALQRSLTQMPAPDAFAGVQVHAHYEPAWEEADVGGDFMDAFSLRGDRLAVSVGDVAGKGLAAAARTAEIKYTLRGMLYDRDSPGAALSDLNNYLCEAQRRFSGRDEEFVCAALAVVELDSGQVTLSVAGAEPPLVVHHGGSTLESTVRGTPLGVLEGMEYREERLALSPRDLLLLLTDGLTEARRDGELFGYERVAASVVRLRQTPALTELAAGLLEGIHAFTGDALHDDACLLLVRRS